MSFGWSLSDISATWKLACQIFEKYEWAYQGSHDTDRPGTITSKFVTPSGSKVAKIKRGLPGFVNGSRTSALADTGAAQNIVSAAFAQEKGVFLTGQAAVFRLGNNKKARSIGKIEEAILIIAFSLNTC